MTSGTQVLLDHSPGTVHVVEVSLQMSQMAHQADAYLCFSIMKQLRAFLFPGWDASLSPAFNSLVLI